MAGLELFANQAQTTVSSGGTTAPSAGTSQTWTMASSAGFPAASSAASPPTFFRITDVAASSEKMIVTNVSGTTWTVTRGAEGTTPVTHSSGFTVQQVLTAGGFAGFSQAASSRQVLNVAALGADLTGATACDTLVNGLITGLGAQGGVIYFPAGTYKISSSLTALLASTQTVTITGDGTSATIMNYYGSGDAIRMYNSSDTSQSYGSGVTDLTIDGTHASAGAAGLHIGDIGLPKLDGLVIQNFSGTSSIGLHVDNTASWTEEADFRVTLINNTSNVVAEVTTGYNSFGYSNWDFTIIASAGQDGVVFKNGGLLYNSKLCVRGDFTSSSTSVSNAVLRLTGACPVGTPNAGNYSAVYASNIDIQVETDDANTYTAQTIYIDTGTDIENCTGILSFQGGFTASNLNVATTTDYYQFSNFSGLVLGDANLNPSGGFTFAGPVLYSLPGAPVYSGICYPPSSSGDFFTVTLAANTTIALNYSGGQQAGAQQKVFVITQAASGGPYTVTWPSTGSPTLTSPTVNWPGGVAPVMSPGASATDTYVLYTMDGITWHGTALQPQGSPASYTQVLATTFTSASSTSAQNVTGMAVTLQPGAYLLKGRFWYVGAGTVGDTESFAFTFGGTASAAQVTWQFKAAAYSAPVSGTAITTSSGASATKTTTTYPLDFEAHVVVTAAGVLQLTATNITAGADEVSVLTGSYLNVQPVAA